MDFADSASSDSAAAAVAVVVVVVATADAADSLVVDAGAVVGDDIVDMMENTNFPDSEYCNVLYTVRYTMARFRVAAAASAAVCDIKFNGTCSPLVIGSLINGRRPDINGRIFCIRFQSVIYPSITTSNSFSAFDMQYELQ